MVGKGCGAHDGKDANGYQTAMCDNTAVCFYRENDNCNEWKCVTPTGTKDQPNAEKCEKNNYVPKDEAICQNIDRCLHKSMPKQTCPGNYCLRRKSCCHWECQDPNDPGTAAEEGGCPTKETWCAEDRQTCPTHGCPDCQHEFTNVKCTTSNVNKCKFQVWESVGNDRRRTERRRAEGAPLYTCPESNGDDWCYVINPKKDEEWQCRKKADDGETAVCASQPNLQDCPVCDVISLPYGGQAKCPLNQCLVQTGCCKWQCQYIHNNPMCPAELQPALTTCTPNNDPDNNDRRREDEDEDEDDELECKSDECIAYVGCWNKQKCIHNSAKWELHEHHLCDARDKNGKVIDIGTITSSRIDAHRKCLGHNKNDPVHECTGIYDASCDSGDGHQVWRLCTKDQQHHKGEMILYFKEKFTASTRGAKLGCTYGVKGKPYKKKELRRRLEHTMSVIDRLRRMEL